MEIIYSKIYSRLIIIVLLLTMSKGHLSLGLVYLMCMLYTVINIKISKEIPLKIQIQNHFHSVLGKMLHLEASKDF